MRGNKLNTTLYHRYYLQSCTATTFRKIENHTKYGQPSFRNHLHIF